MKVLDFVKFAGPILTVGRTIFEMWLGLYEPTEALGDTITKRPGRAVQPNAPR